VPSSRRAGATVPVRMPLIRRENGRGKEKKRNRKKNKGKHKKKKEKYRKL